MIGTQTGRQTMTSFWQRHWAKVIALLLWGSIVASYYWYVRANDLTVADSAYGVAALLTGSLFGPLLYVLMYTLRPLLFFPATILTLLGGFLFGPIGIIYTILGSNASAMLSFGVGWFLGGDVLDGGEGSNLMQRYARRMRENSFETVLIMRLIFLPYDLVNYLSGFLKIDWRAYLIATIVGSVPGTISFVLFGASFGTLDELLAGDVSLNPTAVIISVLLIGISIAISRILKRKEAGVAE